MTSSGSSDPAAPAMDTSLGCLEARRASPRVRELLATAARAVQDRDSDRARSAAERFLFEFLEMVPECRGHFRLNVRREVQAGDGRKSRVEIDLLAERLDLAIEIDGYFHFQDAEAYRRDRRKDLALQRSGLLVLRFLASDVVSRLELILSTLIEAVRERTQSLEFP